LLPPTGSGAATSTGGRETGIVALRSCPGKVLM
jgi:hypothetical protein